MTQRQTINITMPLDLLLILWNTKQPNQTIENRILESINKGLTTHSKQATKRLSEVKQTDKETIFFKKNGEITVTITPSTLTYAWSTRKKNQTISERLTELINKGLAVEESKENEQLEKEFYGAQSDDTKKPS